MSTVREITVDDLARQLDRARERGTTPNLLDVRGRDEYASGHVPGAVNIPLDELPGRLADLRGSGTISAICRSGGRSVRAAAQLGVAGIDAVSVAGGTSAWAASGRPTRKGEAEQGRGELFDTRTGGTTP